MYVGTMVKLSQDRVMMVRSLGCKNTMLVFFDVPSLRISPEIRIYAWRWVRDHANTPRLIIIIIKLR